MTNFGYWTPMDKGQGADNTLIYILAHKSKKPPRPHSRPSLKIRLGSQRERPRKTRRADH
jgi:hypothetical protein